MHVSELESTHEPESLAGFLDSLGLSRYLDLLEQEEVDLEALSCFDDADFESLEIPLGPRMRIKHALAS